MSHVNQLSCAPSSGRMKRMNPTTEDEKVVYNHPARVLHLINRNASPIIGTIVIRKFSAYDKTRVKLHSDLISHFLHVIDDQPIGILD